ncbi:hypothetical protein [Sorangium atrum]|uniref:Uncharacterized protein n=1 Tax=Sorangium atrum TaxID=2995308 RepID=A0ABT5CE35_9BACT|nr:hypothetical protein [Sorangium aterium]MDC0683392.1 hypothetical protein [Sorangium aterium]
MALNRASVQRSKSLGEFFGELKSSTASTAASIGSGMLELLPLMKDACSDRDAWALTSLMRLWLLAADDRSAPWLVLMRISRVAQARIARVARHE